MELCLFNSSRRPFSLQATNLRVIGHQSQIHECRLSICTTTKLYQQLESESLFNLKSELRGSLNALKFHDDVEIEIEAILQPQLLTLLQKQAKDSESALAYLLGISQTSTPTIEDAESDLTEQDPVPRPEINPLLLTENWFALSVKQHLESGEIGYRTFWSYLNPVSLTPDAIANGQFPDAIQQFLKDRNEGNLKVAEQAITTILEEVANEIKSWDETEFVKQTETAISDFISEMTQSLEGLVEPVNSSSIARASTKSRIYQTMLTFFSEEDWEFTKLQGELTLRLACQGKNGRFDCYARDIDGQSKFIFYSYCPIKVPEDMRLAISEFLTRVNFALFMGSFDLNFDTGEIRYKTSIDVTGDRLSPALIKRLVYTNVAMMDEYLPGIKAVIGGKTPEEAIQALEQPDTKAPTQPPSSDEKD
jgi:hypothetical protein